MPFKNKKDQQKYSKEYAVKNREKILAYSKQYYKKNKDRLLLLRKDWVSKNKEKVKLYSKNYYIKNGGNYQQKYSLKTRYNLDLEQYNEMFNRQNDCCAICGKHQSELNKKLEVDHNHKTNKNRGVLCHACNTMIGHAYEDITILQNAILYLMKYAFVS